MRSTKRLLLIAAFLALAVPLIFSGTVSATYVGDGSKPNGTTGLWDITDNGKCVLGIDASGNLTLGTETSRPDCITHVFTSSTTGNYDSQADCLKTSGRTGDAAGDNLSHYWTSTCVANDGTIISLNGLDRTATMCNQAAIASGSGRTSGTMTSLCTSSWVYTGPAGDGAPGFAYTTLNLSATYGSSSLCPTPTQGYAWVGNLCVDTAITSEADCLNRTFGSPAALAAGTWYADVSKCVITGTSSNCATNGGTWSAWNRCTYSYGISGTANGPIYDKKHVPASQPGGPGTAVIAASVSRYAAAGDSISLSSFNQGQALINGASWSTGTTKAGDATVGSATIGVVTGTRAGCMECHNSTSQYNGYAERWKDTYMLTGHKNMLRKVTAGNIWKGPDATGAMVDYATPGWAKGTLNWGTTGNNDATATDTTVTPNVTYPLLYIFGDWMAPAPAGLDIIVDVSGAAKYNGSSTYSCANCHATGWATNSNAGLCVQGAVVKASATTSAACAGLTPAGTWYPSSGVEGAAPMNHVGAEPAASTSSTGFNGTWDRDGIVCSRCHSSVFAQLGTNTTNGSTFANPQDPIQYGAVTQGVSSHNNTPKNTVNEQVNNICFGCHQSIAKTGNGTGTDTDLGNPAMSITVNATNTGFSGHPLGNEFLNSVHARYSAPSSGNSIVPNVFGKYNLVGNAKAQYNSAFAGYICRSSSTAGGGSVLKTVIKSGVISEITSQDDCNDANGKSHGTTGYWQIESQGSCTTCHDVHNSLFTDSGGEAIKRECETCHIDATGTGGAGYATIAPQVDLSKMSHPTGANTPWDTTKFGSSCETCHMPKPTSADFPLHLWRISTDSSYSMLPTTFPAKKIANTATETVGSGTYDAIWVDLNYACGQCHYSTGANYVSGNPVFAKDNLAAAAQALHDGGTTGTNNTGCLSCHSTGVGGAPVIDPNSGASHHYVGSTACTRCHTSVHQGVLPGDGTTNPAYNSTTRLVTPGTGCLYCHGPGKMWTSANYPNGIVPDASSAPTYTDNHHSDHGTCTQCHGVKGGERPNNAGTTQYGGVRKYLDTDGGQFCLTCHSNSGTYGRHHAVEAIVTASMNCMTTTGCHVPGKPGVSNVMPEDNTACLLCHATNSFTSTTGATVRTVTQGTDHHNGECTTCHKAEPFAKLAGGDLSTVGTVSPLTFMTNTITYSTTTNTGSSSYHKYVINDDLMTACLSCHSTAQTRSSDLTTLTAIVKSGTGDNHHQGHAVLPGQGGNEPNDPGLRCVGCHGSGALSGALPTDGSATSVTWRITASGLTPATVSVQHAYTGGADATSSLCQACHDKVQSGGLSAVPPQDHHAGVCLNCHVPDQPGGPGITTPSFPPSNWADCSHCHAAKAAAGMAGVNHSDATSYTPQNCEACHTVAGLQPVKENICFQCHGGSSGTAAPGVPFLGDARLDQAISAGMHNTQPDLVISGLTVPVPYTTTAGGTIPVTVATNNLGPGAAGASTTGLYIATSCSSTTLISIGSQSVGALAAGGTASATVTATIPGGSANGTYYVIAKADDVGNAVGESREDNNTRCAATSPITVATASSDLIINSVSAPLYGKKGTAITVSDVTKNRLTGAAGASTTTVYVASTCGVDATGNPTGTIYSQVDRAVPALAGGAGNSGSVSVTMPATVVPACLIWRADSAGAVPESAENNNTKTKAITVTN